MQAIEYKVIPFDLNSHIFQLELIIPYSVAKQHILRMPAWAPGSYKIRDFAKHVLSLKAYSLDKQAAVLEVKKLDSSSWQVDSMGPIKVIYQVYAFELNVRGAYLDSQQGFFDGSRLFLEIAEHTDKPCRVNFVEPAEVNDWCLATSLTKEGNSKEEFKFGYYTASNYAELIDSPVQMGVFMFDSFVACGIKHTIVITNMYKVDIARLTQDVKQICEAQLKLFGKPYPFTSYLFLLNVTENGYGGLEHRDSTALLCSRHDLPYALQPGEISKEYRKLLGLFSHEYFHVWNVKRLRPKVFLQYDLYQPVYTEQLWFFEGITSYYDDLILLRSGVIKPKEYLELLATVVTRVLCSPGRHLQSVTESSFDAWIKFYQIDENTPNSGISYYAKGALIAFCLDILLRDSTQNKVCLDTVILELWREFGVNELGVAEGAINQVIAKLGKDQLNEFLTQALYSTAELPLIECFAKVGIELKLHPTNNLLEPAKVTMRNVKADKASPNLGNDSSSTVAFDIRVKEQQGFLLVTNVYTGGAGAKAGLAANDLLVAIDGLSASPINYKLFLQSAKRGDKVLLHVMRDGKLLTLTGVMEVATLVTAELIVDSSQSAGALRKDWLGCEF